MSKLYVLVRGDLSKSQQAVQASHAVAGFMLYANEKGCWCGQCESDKYWANETIVLLKVEDEESLKTWCRKVADEWNYPFECFCEPDLDSSLTAFAAYDKDGKLSERLKDLQLL